MRKISLFIIVLFTIFSKISLSQTYTQTIKGQVVDKASQMPLPGASVVILGTDPIKGTTTDFEGYYRIEDVAIGRYDIQYNFIGYETYNASEIQVSTGKEVVLNIELQEAVNYVDEVVVSGNSNKVASQNTMATVSARTFSVEETRRYAGGVDDPARMVSAFAGVTTGNMQDNAISVRGNAPRSVAWRLEGVDIYNPNHFAGGNVAGGGFVTIFSSQLLANSDFFTGAFPAEYGNVLGGVFDMKLRTGNRDKREYTFQAGVLGIDFSAEGPFVNNKKATYLFNYRYSTMSLISFLIPSQQVPKYQDLSLKLNFPTNNLGTFSIWAAGGYDENKEPVDLDSSLWETEWDRIKYDMKMIIGAAGVTHKKILGTNTYINTTLAASMSFTDMIMKRANDDYVLDDNSILKPHDSKYTFFSFLNHKFGSRLTNRTGFILENINYDLEIKAKETPETEMITIIDEEGNSFLYRAYSQFKYSLSDKFNVNFGFSGQYFALNKNYSIEPRAGLQWNFIPKHTLSLGYGNHSQMEELRIYLIEKQTDKGKVFPNENLDFSKAHHFILGYDFMITKNARIKIEPYYQMLYDIPVVDNSYYSIVNFKQDWGIDSDLVNKGTATNLGIDFTIEKFLTKGYYYLITASVFDSKYVGGDGIERNSRFDNELVINGLFGKEFYFGENKNKVLGFNARLVYMGGERIIPFDLEASRDAQELVYDYENAFEDKLEATTLLDLSITYRKNKPKYSSVWAFQIKNALGAKNDKSYYYNLQTQDIEYSEISIVVPVISYKIEF